NTRNPLFALRSSLDTTNMQRRSKESHSSSALSILPSSSIFTIILANTILKFL
ncbi:unnamed protein product, partial [Adineta ricciae]